MTAATADVLRALLDGGQQDGGGVWGLLIVRSTGRPSGTVYPILERLEGAGWVTSSWESDTGRSGPRRRLYALGAEGREAAVGALARMAAEDSRRARATTPGAVQGATA